MIFFQAEQKYREAEEAVRAEEVRAEEEQQQQLQHQQPQQQQQQQQQPLSGQNYLKSYIFISFFLEHPKFCKWKQNVVTFAYHLQVFKNRKENKS
jgi:hypothetical protein